MHCKEHLLMDWINKINIKCCAITKLFIFIIQSRAVLQFHVSPMDINN